MLPVAESHTRRRSLVERERRAVAHRHDGRRYEPGRATLDDRITVLWTGLVDSGAAECPVCGAAIAAARPCGACGSELS